MEIDNRFHQSETEAGSVGTARRFSTVKSIENARQMFSSYPAAIIIHPHLEIAVVFRNRDPN